MFAAKRWVVLDTHNTIRGSPVEGIASFNGQGIRRELGHDFTGELATSSPFQVVIRTKEAVLQH